MDLSSGLPFWLVKNGLPFDYPALRQDLDCEVVILGGGITAAICAYHLSEAGIPYTILEKRSMGLGSTCASTALLQYQIDTPLSELIKLRGEYAANRSYLLCADSITQLENIAGKTGYQHFKRIPSLYFSSYKKDKKLLEREYRLHSDLDLELQYLDAGQVEDLMGFKAPNALLSEHSAQIDAYSFAHHLFQYCLRRKAQIFDRTDVVDIRHAHDRVTLTTANGNRVRCNKLIYATGFEVVEQISKDIVELQTTWSIASPQWDEQTTFWHRNCLIWESKEAYLYIRTTQDRRIMLGGRDEPGNNPVNRERKLKKKAAQLAADFAKMFPHLAFEPEFSWAGTFGSTKDGLPYIGRYDPKPNGLFALGFGGNGITFSVIAARIITDLLLDKENADEKLFAFDRKLNPV